MSDTDQPSIAKQIFGAVIGMIVALVLYQAYEIASPTLEAAIAPYLMTEPHLSAGTQDAGPLNNEKAMQIAERAHDIAARRAGARTGSPR